MKKLLPIILSAVIFISGCGAAFAPNTPAPTATAAPKYTFNAETFPKLAGSFSALPMAEAICSIMLGIPRENTAKYLSFGNTGNSYKALLDGSCGLSLAVLPKNGNDQLESVPLAKDALVFYVDKNNPLNGISVDQLRDIYEGRSKNWSELSGLSKPIKAFQRNEWSGAQIAFTDLVMQGKDAKEPVMDLINMSDGTVAGAIAVFDGADGAIGYNTLFALNNMGFGDSYKILSVNGVKPTAETVASGEYPLIFNYGATIRKDAAKDSPERILYNWLQDSTGKAFIASQGYVR